MLDSFEFHPEQDIHPFRAEAGTQEPLSAHPFHRTRLAGDGFRQPDLPEAALANLADEVEVLD